MEPDRGISSPELLANLIPAQRGTGTGRRGLYTEPIKVPHAADRVSYENHRSETSVCGSVGLQVSGSVNGQNPQRLPVGQHGEAGGTCSVSHLQAESGHASVFYQQLRFTDAVRMITHELLYLDA